MRPRVGGFCILTMTNETLAVTASSNLSATRVNENPDGHGFLERVAWLSKKSETCWCGILAIYNVAKTFDPKSIQGVVVRMVSRTVSAKVNGNRYVMCLNRNDAKRNLNLNNWANDWNDNWGFLGAQRSRFLPGLFAGEFLYGLSSPTAEHFADCRE